MTKRTDKARAATDHSELLNNKRPDIDARLFRDIMQAGTDHEITVYSVEPKSVRNAPDNADLCPIAAGAA